MPGINEHVVIVFVYDRNGNPIRNALVQAIDEGKVIAEATTRGFADSPIRLHFSPEYKSITLKTKAGKHVKEATVDVNAGNYTFQFNEIGSRTLQKGSDTMRGAWFFGIMLLLFFMMLVFLNPQDLAQTQQRVVRFLASVCAGIISAFFAGSLKLGGKIPGLNDITIAAVGGFAAFAFVFLLW